MDGVPQAPRIVYTLTNSHMASGRRARLHQSRLAKPGCPHGGRRHAWWDKWVQVQLIFDSDGSLYNTQSIYEYLRTLLVWYYLNITRLKLCPASLAAASGFSAVRTAVDRLSPALGTWTNTTN